MGELNADGYGARRRKLALTTAALVALAAAALLRMDDALHARAAILGVISVALWLTELVPPFVPTLLLLVATPLLLGGFGKEYELSSVLTWSADPVLALFLGGFALGAAARRHGIDADVARLIVTLSKHRRRTMVALVLGGTALMSMWMSNVAAAAMMLVALRPLMDGPKADHDLGAALLLSVAMGGNLGGIATPIGTGPNAIAIAAAAKYHTITFASWMAFGIPLVLGMLLLVYGILLLRYRIVGAFEHEPPPPRLRRPNARWVIAVFLLAVVGWLSESIHGVSAPLLSLGVAALLFGTGLLGKDDLASIDWSTLGLIAGGILLGKLIEHTGLFEQLSEQVAWTQYPRVALLSALVLSSVLLSAVMSNTGTAALLIPMAMSIVPTPSMAVIVAVATSFGMPFAMSTPPNAMAYAEGRLKASDLLVVGVPTMIVGCVVLALTGPAMLTLFNVP